MNRNKKIFPFAILAASVVTTLGVISTLNTNSFATVKAEDCTHSGEIGHYEATATTIEHWACCTCHQAWADEARTILVRGTNFDNSRSESTYQVANYFDGGYYGWADNALAVYDAEFGFAYKHELTENANEVFYEPKNIQLDFENYSSYRVKVTNNTSTFVNIQLRNGDWSGTGVDINIQAGESNYLVIPEGIKNSGGKDFVLRFGDNYGGKISGTLIVSKPVGFSVKSPFTSGLEVGSLDKSLISNYKDDQYGVVYSFNTKDIAGYTAGNGYPNIYLRGLAELDTTLYTGVEIYIYHESGKDIHFTCWSEDWNGHVCGLDDIPTNTWTRKVITADAWNGDRSSCAVGFYDTVGLNGLVKIAVKGFIENPVQKYVSELNAITLNDSLDNNAYINDFYAKLKPVLDRIEAEFGNNVPQEIASHKNYLDYADATTFEKWDYGTPNVGQENINGTTFAKVTATAAGEQGIISRAFPTNEKAKSFVFSVFNSSETAKAVNVYNGYGDPWNVGGKVNLPAKQWTNISYDKAKFDEFDKGFALIFQGCEVGSEFLVSPVVDYCYDIEGDVVYSDNITVRGNGWASAEKVLTKYGETYTSGHVDSSTEDPEWKCNLLYLNHVESIDAEKYSYVKFYVFNNQGKDLRLSMQGLPSQYNFEESGNLVPNGQWKEFKIPTSIWNSKTGDFLTLIFGANEHHSGTILVSKFVGVNV